MCKVVPALTVALPLYPAVSAANKTALHYDKELLSVKSLHMEDNQPQWDLCQPECETSQAYTPHCARKNTHAVRFTATSVHTKGRENELGRKWRLVFLLRHLFGPRDRWRANQTAWCLCCSHATLPPLP